MTRRAFDVELALDRAEAQIAAVLPAHVRAFARAYTSGQDGPAAPLIVYAPPTLALAAEARGYPELAARGAALERLAIPLAIETDPRVVTAHAAARSAAAYRALAAAREVACRARFGRGHREVMHALHGVGEADRDPRGPEGPDGAEGQEAPRVGGWTVDDGGRGEAVDDGGRGGAVDDGGRGEAVDNGGRGGAVDDGSRGVEAIDEVWRAIAGRYGVAPGGLTIVRAAARARVFVVVPRREVIAVVPVSLGAPAARFAVLHELGHAACALALGDVQRAIDEAHASAAARAMEDPAHPWFSPLARAARARRTAIARRLDAIEAAPAHAGLPATIPWALWGDPQAQAAYVVAEAIADAMAVGA